MRVFVVFLVAALCCSLAGGRLVPKCELRDELMRAIGDLPERAQQKGLTVENLVAKIVCHVESASGFKTSVVNQLITGKGDRKGRGKRNSDGGVFSLAEIDDPSVTIRPNTRDRRQARQPPPNNRPKPPNRPPQKQKEEEVWTLYGLFQLSSHLVCNNGTTASPNICETDCSNLIDDDIRDDISCLLKIFTQLVENGFGAPNWRELRKMIELIYQKDCRYKQASDYLAECS